MKQSLPGGALLLALLAACAVPQPPPAWTPAGAGTRSPGASATSPATGTAGPASPLVDARTATEVGRTVILVPPAIAERPELPWCGHEIVDRRVEGDVYDAGVRGCWLQAYRSGRRAEFVSTGWTVEGGRTRAFYRSLGDVELEVLYDAAGDPAAEQGWRAARCASVREVHTDPRGTVVFVEDGCEPVPLANMDDAGEWPTPHERLVLESLVAFAITGDGSIIDAVPFTDDVALGLGSDVLAHVRANELADPAAWSLQRDGFRGHAGPFSAVDTLARWDALPGQSVREIRISIGEHPHCASPAVAPPAELATLRHLSLQPIGQTSCLAWWSVDAYLTADGRIAGITLDVWEP